jgi:hypothetical protein
VEVCFANLKTSSKIKSQACAAMSADPARPSITVVCTLNIMIIDLLQMLPVDLLHGNLLQPHLLQTLHIPVFHWPMSHDHALLAQQFKETNISGDVSKAWQHFVKTGQVWAFLIGMIFGYLAKTFTSYG